MGRGNQYIQLVKVLYSKLPATGKQLPTFPYKGPGLENKNENHSLISELVQCDSTETVFL